MRTPAYPIIFVAFLACAKSHATAPDAGPSDAGPQLAAPPDALWSIPFTANLYTRALDVSCAPADAQPGADGCVSMIRFLGVLDHYDAGPAITQGTWGDAVFVRTAADGGVLWQQTLLWDYAPISMQTGGFVDDDLRVHLLADGSFLASGTYEGRILVGTQGAVSNQELGPSTDRNPFAIYFNPDGTFSNWEDTGNGKELHGTSAISLANSNLVLVGSCQGDVPLDTGTVACGDTPSGYFLITGADGSTIGGTVFGGVRPVAALDSTARPAEARDVVTDDVNDLFISGSFERELVYGSLPQDTGAGEDDAFLMKIAPDGTRAWIVTAGSLGHDRGGHLSRVSGGVLWTARVSSGANLGGTVFGENGQVVALISDAGAVVWAYPVPDAHGALPLGVTAASDGSFALYGDGFLGDYSASGALKWERTDADARGAGFTATSLVVAASAIGTQVFDIPVAPSGSAVPRSALVAFPR